MKSHTYSKTLKPLGIFRLKDAKRLGVPPSTLAWMVEKGMIRRIDTDTYCHPEIAIRLEEEDFVTACLTFGKKSVIGGLSALFFHKLIEQVPSQIWVMVPPEVTSHNAKYRLIRTKANLKLGISQTEWYRITGVERTIVDAFHFQSKIGGIEMAVRAARTAIRGNLTSAHAIAEMSKQLGWQNSIYDNWEAITIE